MTSTYNRMGPTGFDQSVRKLRRTCPPLVALAVALMAMSIAQGGAAELGPDREVIRVAINKSIPLLEASADFSRSQRSCFTCHHVSSVAITANAAWQRGFKIDKTNLESQLRRTYSELKGDIERFIGGRFPTGQGDLLGHSMWLLKEMGWKPDETTTDTVRFLLEHDQDSGGWKPEIQRPPTVGNSFTTTFVVLQAIEAFRPPDLGFEIRKRRQAAIDWLLQTKSFDTEDMVFRLRSLHLTGEVAFEKEATKLLQAQRKDGGWAQLPQMNSDAYATGTALAALIDTETLTIEAPEFAAGAAFLLKNQQTDGSWHVRSRVKVKQPFYNSFFPHEHDQFISVTASAWATYALLRIFPPTEAPQPKSYLAAHPKAAVQIATSN